MSGELSNFWNLYKAWIDRLQPSSKYAASNDIFSLFLKSPDVPRVEKIFSHPSVEIVRAACLLSAQHQKKECNNDDK